MKRLTVLLSPRAAKEIDEAAGWWAERGSPTLVDDAVGAVFDRLERFPELFPRIQIRRKWSTTRRAIVDPIGFHLYYRFNTRLQTIEVQCFRHQSRRPPRL